MDTQTVMVTGATGSIGRAIVRELAARGARCVLLCRDRDRGRQLAAELSVHHPEHEALVLVVDLADQGSVRRVVDEFLSLHIELDGLVNNAARLTAKRSMTPDAIETSFAVNYLSHFLLSRLLLGTLGRSRQGRIVNVSSDIVRHAPPLPIHDLPFDTHYGALRAYARSKLAQVLFTRELARRLALVDDPPPVSVDALHPGNVQSNMTARGFWIDLVRPLLPRVNADDAGRSCVELVLRPGVLPRSGEYFEKGKPVNPGRAACHDEVGRQLWNISSALTGLPVELEPRQKVRPTW